MDKPNQGDIQTLDDLLAVIKSAPNRQAMKSEPVRLFKKRTPNKRKPSGQQARRFVSFQDGTARELAHLLTTLYPAVKMPAAAALVGQPQTPENVLRACRLNTKTAQQPYDLTAVRLVKTHPKGSTCNSYSVYCSIRDQWSNAATAANLRRRYAPKFKFDSPSHWAARYHVESYGGTVAFIGEYRGPNGLADYTCGHGVLQTVEVGSLAKGNRPTANCTLCRDIAFAEANANLTGTINFKTNLDLLEQTPEVLSQASAPAVVYVMTATVIVTNTPIIKIGFAKKDFDDRYSAGELGVFKNLTVTEHPHINVVGKYIETLLHSSLKSSALYMPELPSGFKTECYPIAKAPELLAALADLSTLSLPDLVTHGQALAATADVDADRRAYADAYTDTRELSEPQWSNYKYQPDPPRQSDAEWLALINKTM